MNSSLMEWLMALSMNILRGGYIELTPTRIDSFMIPNLQESTCVALQSLVDEIRHGESHERVEVIERETDTVVFDAYGVSSSERKLVLDWLGERRDVMGFEMPADWRKLNALRASAGAWKDSIDGEQLKRDIRASRDISTRPVPRL